MKTYKHAASVTSQVYFCSAPIRLDSYDTCQFACNYCFSRERSRYQASDGIHSASSLALRKRLTRVQQGQIASALDEFLAQRVPIQLGGLQDPFTTLEAESETTLHLLEVLRDFNYPTLISTKGSIYLQDRYMELLKGMNLVFRISAAAISEELRPAVERKGDSFSATLEKIRILSSNQIPVALRIQPVFPGFENTALEMLEQAADAGAGQVTFEYLKLPSEDIRKDLNPLLARYGYDYLEKMRIMGLRKLGPDWTLNASAKAGFVRAALRKCRQIGVRFGAGDTEFIPWSDGDGCCGSSSLFLEGSAQFNGNFVGAIKHGLGSPDKLVKFDSMREYWTPQRSIGNYLDWRARIPSTERKEDTDWMSLLARRWNGGRSPYSPGFFFGVDPTGEKDARGYEIYDVSRLDEELRVSGSFQTTS